MFHPRKHISKDTLPETNSSKLKMDGWNTIVSSWGPAFFQVKKNGLLEGEVLDVLGSLTQQESWDVLLVLSIQMDYFTPLLSRFFTSHKIGES